ncbi:MAG: nucleotidyltransferase domain-containing protein [Clostridia bacterium]|nr:nucleotidyltransferase domain-containing protein [Clostridia bacterium]
MKIWLENFKNTILDTFKDRVVFIGIQGSYGREEATESSDIDVVVILDNFTYQDLKTYEKTISPLEHRDKICGFISGKKELSNWSPSDLFQFYHDTNALYGDLSWLSGRIRKDDAWRSCKADACNIYHACIHNALHEKDTGILKVLYKEVCFALQAKYYYKKGKYVKRIHELVHCLTDLDLTILTNYFDKFYEKDFDKASEQLLQWSGDIINGKI